MCSKPHPTKRAGTLRGLLFTWASATFTPWNFFASRENERTSEGPLLFAMIANIGSITLASALAHVASPDPKGMAWHVAMVAFTASLLVPVLLVMQAAMVHLALRVVRAARRPYRNTFACVCYASGLSFAVEFGRTVTLLAFAWWLVILAFGLCKTHEVSMRRTGAALGLLALFCVGSPVTTKAFLLESFKIASRSMLPTMGSGDYLLVNKLAYRQATPKYGDMIVFRYPEHPDHYLTKRVIALPGDRLETVGGRPVINGWQVPQCDVGPWEYSEGDDTFGKHNGELFVEYLGEAMYLAFYDHSMLRPCRENDACAEGSTCSKGNCLDRIGPVIAGRDQVLVLGDNRMNSYDSMAWFGGQGGGVPIRDVVGRALVVFGGAEAGPLTSARTGLADEPPVFPGPLSSAVSKCVQSRPGETTPPRPR